MGAQKRAAPSKKKKKKTKRKEMQANILDIFSRKIYEKKPLVKASEQNYEYIFDCTEAKTINHFVANGKGIVVHLL